MGGKGIHFPSRKGDWKKLEKNNVTIALNILYTKKGKYILLKFQNISQIVKNKLLLLMISNREKQWDYLAVKNCQHY